MAIHTLTIRNWRPSSVNELLGGHWSRGHRLKRKDADLVAVEALAQRVPKAKGRRRVSILIECAGRGRLVDADNCLKVALDSLVGCGLLLDDGPQAMELGSVEVRRGDARRTTVTLEDLE